MAIPVVPIAALQALLEYGTLANASWWARVGSTGDRLLHWVSTHPLEVVLAGIGLLFLYKLFLRP